MTSFVESLKRLPGEDKDAVVPITGPERGGKSTLMFHLGRLIDSSFDYTRPCFSGAEVREKVLSLPFESPYVPLDESVGGAFSRDAMTTENKDFMKFLSICGERNKIIPILHPNLNWLDPYIRNHRAKVWLHVQPRGVCTIYEPQRTRFHSEPFWKPRAKFPFPVIADEDWQRYLQRKHDIVGNSQARVNPGAAHVSDIALNGEIEALVKRLHSIVPVHDERCRTATVI